ncbi:Predicted arabinose efflux permease, MFS family [Agreia bicolorata]|uniref:Predicted arabinose efflux permease, MFS family n=1 Tax=Agreia bicolorata TaxID=110935 RepID=A0A1T4XBG8_9MICO|nr:MFS transporter [Agreia bicolorata]SKA86904.1 Predicted arabinose efflux permease, MFS family [Agreia bicolorata]
MSDAETGFRFRSIALPALLPSLLFAIGEGSIIPIIPAIAQDLGAGLALAGFIAAMIMVGELIGDIPSGWIVSRIGERRAMVGASLVSIIGVTTCIVASGPWMLGVGIFLLGLSTATFALARHAFMTTFVPLQYRARALSTLGGTFRAGWFVGPFIAAGLIALTAQAAIVFWVHLACAVIVIVLLMVMPDPTAGAAALARAQGTHETEGEHLVAEESHGLFRTVWNFRGVLVRLGTGVAILGALRASRSVILPLWAVSLGLPESTTALIIGLGGAMDFALFYASGQVMDRFGRLWSVVPSMLGMGIGLFVLAFTHDLQHAVGWFIGVTAVTGLANGIGSGILMTLGADLAPKDDPAPFLGAFRFTGDAGTAAAPLLVSLIVAVATLSLSTAIMGVVGVLGAGLMLRYVPRYVPRRPGRPSA